ncbi:uncharacterized protein BJ171DRAFT_580942 [Polychytrium aggregatum]|uniref:uncharacterized protein n=1 Tax=Polychytrium aggregatum TaxID=110093 RepID=UPI0022FDCA6E|nr:uncharacterized protein BJ171DRAFT_580942 [Polychytrium aggregatum]KAI9205255.1 hypothetical protein BJ171DRAFT_580942 [Polychytrium aggregatum]
MSAMENTIMEVQKHCGLQLKLYSRCIEQNPSDWTIKCREGKSAVSKCAEENVGHLKRTKERCSAQIEAMQRCSIEHEGNADQMCAGALRALYDCTNAA